MKTVPVLLLAWIAAVASAVAGMPAPLITIETKDSVVRYEVDVDRGSKPVTIEELEKIVRARLEPSNPPVIVTDDATSFRSVVELIRRLKAVGVERFCVALRDPNGARSSEWVTITANQIKTDAKRIGADK